MDNWLYTSEYATDYRWTRGGLESAKTLSRGQWGISMDDTGRIFRNWNDDPLHLDYLPRRVLARNPSAVRTRGVYEPVTGDLEVWAARPTPAVNRGYRDGRAAAGRIARHASRRPARPPSIAAIACRPTSAATSSSPSRPATSYAAMS